MLSRFAGSKSVLGIDFGTHSVKIVEMSSVHGELAVLHGAVIRIPPEEADYDISQQIRIYLDSQHSKANRAVIALPASSGEAGESDTVVWQILERPEIPVDVKRRDLMKALQFELEELIAYDPTEAVFDAQILYPSADGTGSIVLVVIAPRSLVEQRIDLLRQADLQPIAVDLDFFALERLAEYTGQLSKQSQALLVEVGETKTSVGFYQSDRLQAIFDFHAGGRNISNELQRNLNLDHLDAEEAKHSQVWIEHVGEVEDEDDSFLEALSALGPQAGYLGGAGTWRVDAAIENSIDDQRVGICPPLRSCFDSYETEFPDAQISIMVLAGGTAQLYNFPELLMERFGIQVEKISYADRLLWPMDNAAVRDVQANEPTFAVAIGLAMKTLAYKLPVVGGAPQEDILMEEEADDQSGSVTG